MDRLKAAGIRVKMDASDQSLGWKSAEYEMKGVPPAGGDGAPRILEKTSASWSAGTAGRSSLSAWTSWKTPPCPPWTPSTTACTSEAKKNLDDHIFEAHSLEEAKELQEKHGGFIKTMWCGELDCELKMKEEAGMTSRCIPFAPPPPPRGRGGGGRGGGDVFLLARFVLFEGDLEKFSGVDVAVVEVFEDGFHKIFLLLVSAMIT